MGAFNDFNNYGSSGLKTKLTKNQKIAITFGIIGVILLVALLCFRSCSSSSSRNNTIQLAKMYTDKGEYDRALDKLENLLLKNANDKEVLELMDKIIAMKEGRDANQSGVNANVKVELDTDGLTAAMQSTIDSMKDELARSNENMKSEIEKNNKAAEESRRAMADLLQQQKDQAAKEAQRQKEAEKQAKLAEEQRKKDEAAKKAAEEALAKKNAALKKEIASVNDEIQQGRTALGIGKIDEALKHFENAQKNLPISEGEPAFSASKYSEMASLLYNAGENASSPEEKKRLQNLAVAYAENAVACDPNDAPAQYILGMDAFEKKDYKKALDCLTKAVSSDNKNYLYYYNLGRVQYMMKKYTEAKSSFGTACRLNSGFAPARYNLGMTDNKLNDVKAALSDFRMAHDIDPRHEKAYLEEARVLLKMGDANGAISAYQNVIKLNSANRAALQELGSAYTMVGKLSDAEQSFRKSLALLPSGTADPLTYYNLSTVLFEEGKSDESVTYAKKAYDSTSSLKDNNSKVNITYNYALISDKTGDSDTAISKYAEVLQLNPNHLKTQINLGVMYMGMNPPDTEMALSLFTKAYNQDKNNFEANNNLGSAYLARKEYKNAVLYFQNALKLDSKNLDVRSNLAQAFASDGQYDNAKTTYLELLRQKPDFWDGYIELGKVCMALNDNESAGKYLEFLSIKNPNYRKAEVDSLLSSIR